MTETIYRKAGNYEKAQPNREKVIYNNLRPNVEKSGKAERCGSYLVRDAVTITFGKMEWAPDTSARRNLAVNLASRLVRMFKKHYINISRTIWRGSCEMQ